MRRVAILCFGVLALAGCGGGGPTLSRTAAQPLAREADAVAARLAAGDACGARAHALALQRRTSRAIDAGAVPAGLREPLRSRVDELVSELAPECLPSVTPEAPSPTPQQSTGTTRTSKHDHGHGDNGHGRRDHGHGTDRGHGHGTDRGHGHGKKGGGR